MRAPRPSSRRVAPYALAALAPLLSLSLAACGGDDEEVAPVDGPTSAASEASSATPEPSESPSASTSTSAPASALPAACSLLTEGDVAKTTGLAVGPGKAEKGDDSDGGVSWRTDECQFEADGVAEVTIKVTGPGDVTKGAFGCPQPDDSDGNVEPADDVANATKGWWKVNGAPPLEATLRACSATANVDVDLDYDDGVNYDGDPRGSTAQLAGFVLANLQG